MIRHPYNKRIRMTPFRLRQLERLRAAGADGLPLLATREAELWRDHQLVELFEDPRRVLTQRVRLTAIGKTYAEGLQPQIKEVLPK